MTAAIRKLGLLSAEDGAALIAHPDTVLKPGERFVCSCGQTAVSMTLLRVSWPEPHDEPAHCWCPSCGDMARWEA